MSPNGESLGIVLSSGEVESLQSAFIDARSFLATGLPQCLRETDELQLPSPGQDGAVVIDGQLLEIAEASWMRAYGVVSSRLKNAGNEYDGLLTEGADVFSNNPRCEQLEQQLAVDTPKAAAYIRNLIDFQEALRQTTARAARTTSES